MHRHSWALALIAQMPTRAWRLPRKACSSGTCAVTKTLPGSALKEESCLCLGWSCSRKKDISTFIGVDDFCRTILRGCLVDGNLYQIPGS